MSFSAQTIINLSHGRSWLREQQRFIQAAGNTSHEFGLGRLAGRIYALLFLESKPMCLDDIMAKLSISKASASITLRRMATWKLVQRVAAAKDRRDFYQIETDFSKALRGGLVPLATSKLASAGQMLDCMLAVIPAAGAFVDGHVLRKRLEESKALQDNILRALQSSHLMRFLQ